MSDTHLNEALLNDAADGTLADGDAGAVRAHLDGCGECAERVRDLRSLLEDARRLSAPIEPERDLWTGIQARIRAESNEVRFPVRTAGASARVGGWPGPLRAAAAVALLLTGVAAGLLIARAERTPGEALATSAAGDQPVPVVTVDGPRDLRSAVADEYENPLAELAAELERRRAQLPPEAIAEIERNLAIVDRAIDAARAAFDESPGDPVLPHMLHRAYGRKVELLEQAVGLPRSL